MGTTLGSLGNKNRETSSSESPSWVRALADSKVVHRLRQPRGFGPWTYRLHNLDSTIFFLSCKICLGISQDTMEYNSFCAWAPPLLDRETPHFTLY